MRLWVTVSEMCITDAPLSLKEADTLAEHAAYLSQVRGELGVPIRVSKKSGHRPVSYEKSKGRSGDSEHSTFHLKGRGAVDLIYYKELLDKLIEDNFYTRICYYPNNGFIHADRKPGPRAYFEASSPTAAWKMVRRI
jgi:hypothetical protein